MSSKVTTFRNQLRETAIEFLWGNWAHLGVQVNVKSKMRNSVDLEPLLLLTFLFGRANPRLFDEALQWLCSHGQWVNVSRLMNLQKEHQIADQNVVYAVVQYLSDHGHKRKWGHFLPPDSIEQRKEPLFHVVNEDFLGDDVDPSFGRWGILRSPFTPRKKSVSGDFWSANAISLKCRALFGVNVRSDAFTYLLLNGEGTASTIASRMGYAQRWVSEVLNEMIRSSTLASEEKANQKVFRFKTRQGYRLLFGLESKGIQWFHWIAFAAALSKLWKFSSQAKLMKADDRMGETELLLSINSIKNLWTDCGIYFSRDEGLLEIIHRIKLAGKNESELEN